jgi:hypothetical protein
MTRIARAWAAMSGERRLAAVAALALLVTMFFPWYGLQSVGPKGVIYSHNINAFGDISFVEAAVFLVAAGVVVLLIGRAERREFALPGGDGTVITAAGGWATLLIFYRVFDRPSGHGYPVGIQWGFFLAFVAAGSLAYAGWRIRHGERPGPPLRRHAQPEPPDRGGAGAREAAAATGRSRSAAGEDATDLVRRRPEQTGETAVVSPPRKQRPRFPPRPGEEPEQLSFEDPPDGR